MTARLKLGAQALAVALVLGLLALLIWKVTHDSGGGAASKIDHGHIAPAPGFTLGRLDGSATLEEVAAHVAALSAATDLPVSVDLENGYDSPGETIRRIAAAGAVGGSIEDWDGERLYEREEAVERVAAATEAAGTLPFPFTLTGRAENFIRGNPDLDDTIARLNAYADAGADVLYAPGLRTTDEIRAVCSSVPRPVNVLARPDLTFAEITGAGARRVSVGGALTWVAAAAFAEAATAIRDRGDFSALAARPPLHDWLSA
jgi:2-methylisocitrate lyase-like PEP mutase family enzyme